MVAKKSAEAYTSGSQDKMQDTNKPTKVDPSVLTMFLKTYMKLLCDNKAVKSLQELINKCPSKENALHGHRVVRKIGKHKARTGHKMRLTVQIEDYEMEQVILDMGSDANIFQRKTWE